MDSYQANALIGVIGANAGTISESVNGVHKVLFEMYDDIRAYKRPRFVKFSTGSCVNLNEISAIYRKGIFVNAIVAGVEVCVYEMESALEDDKVMAFMDALIEMIGMEVIEFGKKGE